MSDLVKARHRFQAHLTNSLRNLQKPSNFGELAQIQRILPEIDSLIQMHREEIQKKTKTEENLSMKLIKEKFHEYRETRWHSLVLFYERQFSHYIDIIEELSLECNDISTRLKNLNPITDKDIEFDIGEIMRNHHNDVKELQTTINEKLSQWNQNETSINDDMNRRLDIEKARILDHFLKVYNKAQDTLALTNIQFDKNKEELEELKKSGDGELEKIIERNNKSIEEHRQLQFTKIDQDESLAKKLSEESELLEEQLRTLVPVVENSWRLRESEILSKFEKEDREYENLLKTKTQKARQLESELTEKRELSVIQKQEISEQVYQKAREFELRLRTIINKRDKAVEGAAKEVSSRLQAREKHLRETLEALKKAIKEETDAIKSKLVGKRSVYADRLQKIENKYKRSKSELETNEQNLKESIENVKTEWQQHKTEINNNYSQQISEIQEKINTINKYHAYKIESLQKELGEIIKQSAEQAKIVHSIVYENETVPEIDKNEVLSDITAEHNMSLNLIKSSHIKQKNELEETLKIYEGTERELSKQLKDIPVKKETEIVTKIIEDQFDKWREDFYTESKFFKEEEAVVLKTLDDSKQEFKAALRKTIELKGKIAETSRVYEEAVQVLNSQNDEHITKIKQVIEEKERELAELEIQFEENQKDLNRKVHQIERAEDKLVRLREKLSEEVTKAKENIKREYQPLLKQEQRRHEVIVNELEKLRGELELSIAFKKQDLIGIETANEAMRESLVRETNEMVSKLRERVLDEVTREEDNVSKVTSQRVQNCIDQCKKQIKDIESEMQKLREDSDRLKESEEETRRTTLLELNDKCRALSQSNSEIRTKIEKLLAADCKNCPKLAKVIRRLESEAIKIQIDSQRMLIESKNHRETLQTFHKKPLPDLIDALSN